MTAERQGLIECQASQPRAEFTGGLVAIQVSEGADVSGTHGLLGYLVVAQDAARDPVQPAVVPAHQRLEGTGIPPASTLDEQ